MSSAFKKVTTLSLTYLYGDLNQTPDEHLSFHSEKDKESV